jgi:hypothetical protein
MFWQTACLRQIKARAGSFGGARPALHTLFVKGKAMMPERKPRDAGSCYATYHLGRRSSTRRRHRAKLAPPVFTGTPSCLTSLGAVATA